MASWGRISRVGVEGTGSYGAGLARHLTGAGIEVVEVNRRIGSYAAGRARTTTPTLKQRLGLL